MSENTEEKFRRLNQEELDWIQLRKELNDLRGQEKRRSFMSKETWYLPTGLAVTVACFAYGFYHMHHPTKSIIGAYLRILSQGLTGIAAVHVFLKFSEEDKPKTMINTEYHD